MIDETIGMKKELVDAIGIRFYSNDVISIYPKKGAKLLGYDGGRFAYFTEIKTGKVLKQHWRIVWNAIFY